MFKYTYRHQELRKSGRPATPIRPKSTTLTGETPPEQQLDSYIRRTTQILAIDESDGDFNMPVRRVK